MVIDEYYNLKMKWTNETQFKSFWDNSHYKKAVSFGTPIIHTCIKDLRQDPNWFAINLTMLLMPCYFEIDNETEAGRLGILTKKLITWYDDGGRNCL